MTMVVTELIETELERCISDTSLFDLNRVIDSASFTHTQNSNDFSKNKIAAISPVRRKKLLLSVLNYLRLKRLSRKEIAKLFAVTPRTVGNWLHDLKREYKREAASTLPVQFVADTLAFYDGMREECLKMADNTGMATGARLKAIQRALEIESGKHEFLERVGFFEGMDIRLANNPESQRFNVFRQ